MHHWARHPDLPNTVKLEASAYKQLFLDVRNGYFKQRFNLCPVVYRRSALS
jgi:hypothetical protein